MRILWLKTELLHPLDKGGRLRTYHTLRQLKRYHEVHYLALGDPDEIQGRDQAAEYCHTLEIIPHRAPSRRSPRFWWGAAANLVQSRPYAISRYSSAAMRRRVAALDAQRSADLVICDFLAPSQNVPSGLNAPSILFQHNVEARIWERHAAQATNRIRRAYLDRQWRLMEGFERRECARFDMVIAVSSEDEAAMRRYGAARVASVPTGVDTEFFRPSSNGSRDGREIVFTGSLDWLPNEDAVALLIEEILPRIREELPEVRLTLVGRRPSLRVRRLCAESRAVRLAADVPDVRPYLESGSVFVVPLRIGGGTRLKIFEAMAMEIPVVSTSVGAEGLPLTAGIHLEIRDDPAAFAGAVVQLLRDSGRREALARRAADLVRREYDWRAAGEAFTRLCEGLQERRAR